MQPYMMGYPMYQQQFPALTGRIVNDFSEVSASDVSMNGQPSVFIKADLSEVNIRKWENNGTISNLAFKPVLNALPVNCTNATEKSVNDPFKSITDRLDELTTKIDSLCKPNKPKKEVNTDD